MRARIKACTKLMSKKTTQFFRNILYGGSIIHIIHQLSPADLETSVGEGPKMQILFYAHKVNHIVDNLTEYLTIRRGRQQPDNLIKPDIQRWNPFCIFGVQGGSISTIMGYPL